MLMPANAQALAGLNTMEDKNEVAVRDRGEFETNTPGFCAGPINPDKP